jgi:glucose-6-phosphate 1-dehydrogenase
VRDPHRALKTLRRVCTRLDAVWIHFGAMPAPRCRSDALVFFGATGDLAYRKIFPALQAMARRDRLDFPVVGVAKSGWTRDQFINRATASLTDHGGGVDPIAFPKLVERLAYVDGDYHDSTTFTRLRAELSHASRPAHYLAIPPSMFPLVIRQLHEAGCTDNARVVVEKPFGRDLPSARELNGRPDLQVRHQHQSYRSRART